METGPRTRGNASGARGGGKNSTTVGHLPGAQGAKAALGPFSTGGGCHTSRHKQGRGGARELAFISTASRTKRNELKLRREGLKLDIQGKNLPDAKAGEVTEQVMGRGRGNVSQSERGTYTNPKIAGQPKLLSGRCAHDCLSIGPM